MILNMKNILSVLILISGILSVSAQESIATRKGDFAVSVNFGVGSYIGMSAPAPDLPDYTLSAPMTGWFDKNPILDIEGRWFASDKWALKLSAGFSFGHNPGHSAVPGTGSNLGDIPTYNAVPKSNNMQFAITTGAERYFQSKVNGLFFRVGGELGYAYGRNSAKADDVKYMGTALAEAYTLKVAPVVGIDYFFNQVLFVGVDVRPLAYHYSIYNIRPQEGLGLLKSKGHSLAIVAQPMVKLGFKF